MIAPVERQTEATQQFGRYRLLGKIATGGMAQVWAAQLLGVGGFCRSLVIKRIHPHMAQHPEFLRMLIAEARLAARLNHANICSVQELGEVDQEPFIAMEYLRGASLCEILKRGPLPAQAAIAIVAQVCDGLHYAHELRDPTGASLHIVHRDISPQNLFVTVDGAVKVLDFGIAKVEDGVATQVGVIKGKLPYMSPEQLEARPLDRRSDLWSLGVVLWELLAGRSLFGNTTQALQNIQSGVVPTLASYGGGQYDSVVAKAVCPTVTQRYETALELKHHLLDALAPDAPWAADQLAALVWDRVGSFVLSRDRLFTDAAIRSSQQVETTTLASPTIPERPSAAPDTLEPMTGAPPSVTARHPWLESPWRAGLLLLVVVSLGIGLWFARERSTSAAPQTAVEPDHEARPIASKPHAPQPPPDVETPSVPVLPPHPTAIASTETAAIASTETAAPSPARATPSRSTPRAPTRRAPPATAKRAVATTIPPAAPSSTPPPAARPGKLWLDARPYGRVTIDGKAVGDTPLIGIAIDAGDHTITVTTEDGRSKTLQIHVDSEAPIRRRIEW